MGSCWSAMWVRNRGTLQPGRQAGRRRGQAGMGCQGRAIASSCHNHNTAEPLPSLTDTTQTRPSPHLRLCRILGSAAS